jgi:bifunctional non-homologous end joining protein LigD
MATRKSSARTKRTSVRDPLKTYREKRRFNVTSEPAPGKIKKRKKGLEFVIQKHDATRLHYDVRLEIAGTMMSFAVPKGPSYDPSEKRLAVQTEDHPMAYNKFEGEIPHGEYGGGPVVIWDRGSYESVPPGEEEAMRAKGRLHVRFMGEKMEGEWYFVRTRGLNEETDGRKSQWLMFKAKDDFADPKRDPVNERPESVVSGKLLPRDQAARPRAARRTTKKTGTKKMATKRKSAASEDKGDGPGVGKLLRTLGEVQKATLVRELEGPASNYKFEIKYDGYRILAIKSGDDARLVSRNGKDWTDQFPTVAAAVAKLRAREIVLDGEVCALDAQGRPSFNLLQNLMGGSSANLSYPVFDLLWIDGEDVRALPMEERRARLEVAMKSARDPLALSSTIEGNDWREILAVACRGGLEGVIAKRKGSRYTPGRSKDWLKLKCTHRQEFAIVGYLPFTGTTNAVGSLLIAVMGEDGEFHFAGKVGTGFNAEARRSIAKQLDAHRVPNPTAKGMPRIKIAHFSEPRLVGEVEFTEWTPDGKIRHPAFQGLRKDKTPQECVREEPVMATKKTATKKTAKRAAAKTDVISNPDKVLFPNDGITKRDVLEYYRAVADVMIPHLKGRPLALQRWPNGIDKMMWFQQNAPPKVPDFVRLIPIADRRHVVVENVQTLEWLSNLAALTLHQWHSREPKLDRPDYVVFDLDPGAGTWANLISVAMKLRATLEDLELESVVKTSGKRGIHVLVPLKRTHTYAGIAAFAEKIADEVAAALPKIATTQRMKAKRGGRLYVDHMQNGQGKTVVAPYTIRAVDGATVSTPIQWSEVTEKLDPKKLTIKTVLKRLDKYGDLLAPLLKGNQTLPPRGST